MVRLTTCPRGTAEGLIVLSVRGDASPAEVERELTNRPGLWAVRLDGEFDWSTDEAAQLLEAFGDTPITGTIDLADPPTSWPSAEVNWVADATVFLSGGATDHDLALRLGALGWLPPVRDLFADLDADQLPPSATVLSMLETALRPSCCYLYLARDYPYQATLLRNVATSSTPWAVRWR